MTTTSDPHTEPETARLTADVILFGVQAGLHVLLIRRASDPYKGHYALPGGHLDVGEAPEAAARRELVEETGLAVPIQGLEPLGVYAEPGRDPRGRYVTWAYTTTVHDLPTPTAGDDAATAEWLDVDRALASPLAFDHDRILRDAVDRQRGRSERAARRLEDTGYTFDHLIDFGLLEPVAVHEHIDATAGRSTCSDPDCSGCYPDV